MPGTARAAQRERSLPNGMAYQARAAQVGKRYRLVPEPMELTVFIDFNSANCRLALAPTRQLAGATGARIDWRPHARKPKPKRPLDPHSRAAQHRRVRSDYRRGEERFYAQRQGLALVYPDANREAFAAHAGLAWLRRSHRAGAAATDAYVQQVFERVWSGLMDPCDRQAVADRVAAAGGSVEGFDVWLERQAEAELDEHRQFALQSGAVEVPGYLVVGEPFVGRANLPVIRQLLANRVALK